MKPIGKLWRENADGNPDPNSCPRGCDACGCRDRFVGDDSIVITFNWLILAVIIAVAFALGVLLTIAAVVWFAYVAYYFGEE